MTSLNNQGVVSYDFVNPGLEEGQVTDMRLGQFRTMRNPTLAQINTVTIASFGTDTDSITLSITLPSSTTPLTFTTTRASNVPVDDAAAATALAALVNASSSANGHVEATTDSAVLTLTFQHPGITYAVSTAVTGCTATVATSQAAGGSVMKLGRFVAAGTDGLTPTALRALTTSDTGTAVRGVTVRAAFEQVNNQSGLATDDDSIAVGSIATVIYEGPIAMRNNGSVAAAEGGQVWAGGATTGGDEVGEARADGSGVAQVATLTAVADHQVYAVKAGVRVNGELRELTFQYAPTDGTTTTDVAIDGLEFQAALEIAAQGFTGIISASSASASATMTLTAAAGYAFEYVTGTAASEDTAAEGVTVSVATLARYAIPLDPRRFYWAEAVAVGAVGRVMCRA